MLKIPLFIQLRFWFKHILFHRNHNTVLYQGWTQKVWRRWGGGGGGGIDCWRHVSSGVSREMGREGVSRLIRGSGGLPREIFKIGLLESASPCYFQVILINLAGWFYFFFLSISGGRGFENCWGNILLWDHSVPSTDSRRAGVSFWQKNVYCTG